MIGTGRAVELLAGLCAELPASYVTVSKRPGGSLGVTLQYDTDEDTERAGRVFGIVLTTRTLDGEYWLGGSVRLNNTLDVSVYGPHREFAKGVTS